MERSKEPLHGICHDPWEGWQVWSHCLQYPVRCGSATDAKRIAMTLEAKYPHGAGVDYSEVDAAIESTRQPIENILN